MLKSLFISKNKSVAAQLLKNGICFTQGLRNSPAIRVSALSNDGLMEPPQVATPTPINNSLARNPKKILPNKSKNNGAAMFTGISCASTKIGRCVLFVPPEKVSINKRIE